MAQIVFIKLVKDVVRDGIRRKTGAIMLVTGEMVNQLSGDVRATDSSGELLNLFYDEFEVIRRKDEQR